MTRRHTSSRTAAVGGAVVAAALLGPLPLAAGRPAADPTPSALTPAAAAELQGLAAGDTTTVVVRMKGAGVDTQASGRDRAERRRALVSSLHERAAASQRSLAARLAVLARRGDVTASTSLWAANAVSVTATPAVIAEIAARGDVEAVEPDAIEVTLTAAGTEPNIAQTGAPTLWAAGRTGQGAVVGILDTGVDPANPDLAARWRGGTDSWFDPYAQHTAPADLNGHGTGVAGIAVGGTDAGTAYGMAPGARWIAARVFDDRGASTATAIHQAFQWMLDPDGDPATDDAPDVVNASWVLGSGPSCDLSFQADVQALRAAAIIPVFAAGNFGPSAGSSASPGNYPESLSVGAVTSADAIWAYSSGGPSTCGGRDRVLPDLVAPGVSVLTADRDAGYQYLSGTSLAAPHVSGALALLLGGHPTSTPAEIEAALVSTALDLGTAGPDERYGNGRIDVAAADAALPTPPPVVADFALSATPTTVTLSKGRIVHVTVQVSALSGSPGPVTMSFSHLPKGVLATWSTNPVAVPGTVDLAVRPTNRTKRGSYRLDLTGTSGSTSHTVSVTLVAP